MITNTRFCFIAGLIGFGCMRIGETIAVAQAIDADIVLSGGTLHLGDGEAAVVGDVAIRDDRIVAVGDFESGEVLHTIDCTGLHVSPGFIDLHNHSDRGVVSAKTRSVMNFLTQGCTTIVTGNCGSGPVDAAAYYKKLDTSGVGVNVAHLLPQGGLRGHVMGSDRREATDKELTEMKRLARKAMQDGCWGMSTGLIYVPSSYADTDELIAIARIVSEHGGIYASHIRGEGTGLLESVEEALTIGKQAKLPVHISHFKSSGKNSWGLVRVAIDVIEKRRQAGQKVTADQYPYTASSTSIDATFLPPWARAGGRSQLLKRLKDETEGKRILDAIRKKLTITDEGQRIQIASYKSQPDWTGRRLKKIADDLSIAPLDLVLQIIRSGGASIVNHSINEDDVRFVMNQPWVATASDGSTRIPSFTAPHPRSYGTFPRKLGHYATRQSAIPLNLAVRSCCGLPADILGLKDRGYLRKGYKADVVVWEADELIDRATFEAPHRYSHGMRYVYVNGTPAIFEGDPTGALAGEALRKPQPSE